MLTKMQAYSSWLSAPELTLDDAGREETDLIQIRGITGLDPVKATINTSPFGSVDGAAFTGSDVGTRNIVLTLHPNPNWDNWTFESLRRLLYAYFMPKLQTRLVFYSDDMPPVEIYGYVEDVNVNQFSQDLEMQVSIICPDPYFTAVDPTVITGNTFGGITQVNVQGDVAVGINVKVSYTSGSNPSVLAIYFQPAGLPIFYVQAPVTPTLEFVMNSVPGNKYVQNLDLNSSTITNLLSKIIQGSVWPILQPGSNPFQVTNNGGVQDWTLTYYEKYGGL